MESTAARQCARKLHRRDCRKDPHKSEMFIAGSSRGNVNLLDLLFRFPSLPWTAGLEYLKIENNDLTGTIPPELGNLVNLQWLYLNENQFTGTIPPELGNLVSVTKLQPGCFQICLDSRVDAIASDCGGEQNQRQTDSLR